MIFAIVTIEELIEALWAPVPAVDVTNDVAVTLMFAAVDDVTGWIEPVPPLIILAT